jgi:hypothetical protein
MQELLTDATQRFKTRQLQHISEFMERVRCFLTI